MLATPQRDTGVELRIRRKLHKLGLRYLVDSRPCPGVRSRADIVFRGARLAVFVDGCFWHGCPDHMTWPKNNEQFWRAKISANKARDAATEKALVEAGWRVLRIWEHEDPEVSCNQVLSALRRTPR